MAKQKDASQMTDEELEELEKRIKSTYQDAWNGTKQSINEFLINFAKQDKDMQQRLEDGSIDEKTYNDWLRAQVGRSERWAELRDQMAERITNTNKVVTSYVNDKTPSIYTLNHNYSCYEIEQGTGASFTLVDEQTIKNLMEENNQVEFRTLKVDPVRDYQWNKQKIDNALTSGILQGKSTQAIANDFFAVMGNNYKAAIRNARTAITSAQNAGRQASYEQATEMGIEILKEWIATLDDKTRESHQELDGERVPYDEPFSNGLDYPGDPKGAPGEVYNCRCTMRAIIPGINDKRDEKRIGRDPDGNDIYATGMTYTGRNGTDSYEDYLTAKFTGGQTGKEDVPEYSNLPAPTIEIKETVKFDTGLKAAEYFRGESTVKRNGKIRTTEDESKETIKWEKGLTFDENNIIYAYTSGSFENINGFLRKNLEYESDYKEKVSTGGGSFSLEKASEILEGAIDKYTLTENITVYREMENTDIIKDLKVGSVFHDDGFGSTSVIQNINTEYFAENPKVHMTIDVPEGKGVGAYIDALSMFENEEFEFLLNRGADYCVNSIEEKDGEYYVKATICGFTKEK